MINRDKDLIEEPFDPDEDSPAEDEDFDFPEEQN
jgi:hypothetical protein